MTKFATSRPQCEVADCQNSSINATTRLCVLHWSRRYLHGDVHADHDRVGATESGFGLYGIITRGQDFVLCHECGKTFKTLGSHIRFTHEMTSDEYRDRHGLSSRDQLMCESLLEKIGTESAARIGTPQWEKFVKRRDETISHNSRKAAKAPRRAGARKKFAINGTQNHARAREWACVRCGKPTLPGRKTCGEECTLILRQLGVAKRDARRLGEEENFIRRTGTGKKLRFNDVLEHLAITDSNLRTRIRRGRFPTHAGREYWFAFWWESDLGKGNV